jgi:hypothetical protein
MVDQEHECTHWTRHETRLNCQFFGFKPPSSMFVEIPPHLRSATSCGASRDAHRIRCRWSSRTCAGATGGGISGLGATSPPPAATSRTMSYFSIFRSTNLPAPAGSYSVGEAHRGEHEPILGRDLFEAVQAKRSANAVSPAGPAQRLCRHSDRPPLRRPRQPDEPDAFK